MRIVAGAALILLGCAAPHRGIALSIYRTCSVSATAVAFGTYTIASSTPLPGTGTITLSCSDVLGLFDSWTIALNAGVHGSFAQRKMQSAGSQLAYNLYTSSSYTTVWGDGTAGTSLVSDGTLLSALGNVFHYTVYGRVTPLQDLSPGSYSDTITIDVEY